MKRKIFFLSIVFITVCCKSGNINQVKEDNKDLAALLDTYFNERMQLYPLEATNNGDYRFNNLFPAEFTDSYRDKSINFFKHYQTSLNSFNRNDLNDNDKTSYDIFRYEIDTSLELLVNFYMSFYYSIGFRYMPFDQFNSIPLIFAQMGGGTWIQPFKTVTDYENWLQRAAAFSSWTDSAIVYFKKGIKLKIVLPEAAVDPTDEGTGYRFSCKEFVL
jgi:uncharacterized protein (DUF885 family)